MHVRQLDGPLLEFDIALSECFILVSPPPAPPPLGLKVYTLDFAHCIGF